jgi:hypothetical protein
VNEVAVVTAVAGAYDHPRSDTFLPDVDYLFFHDELTEPTPGWQALPLPDHDGGPRRRAKLPKLDPHALPELRRYRYVIWVDGGISIIAASFVPEILGHIDNGMAVSPHFDGRDCAYGEAMIRPPKYAAEPLDDQVAYYRSRGFPLNAGLYECGVLARDMEHPVVPELGALWRAQVERWSFQDQVSFPYCLWRLDYRPGVLPRSFRNMNWVTVSAHRRED